MDAGRLPSRLAAALSSLADPDAQDPATRTFAYLAWAVLLSVALHAALLSWLGTMPFRFDGRTHLVLNARMAPMPASAPQAPASGALEAREPAKTHSGQPGSAAPAVQVSAQTVEPATLPHLYFASGELDVPAQVLEKPPLVYPENPYLWKLRGSVRVRVFIGEDGGVDAVELVSADPPGHFEEAALAAARKLRYRPAEIRGQPVRSRRLIEILFDPHEQLRAADPR